MAQLSFVSALVVTIASLTSKSTAAQIIDDQLVGTWSTKSAKVLTGPYFYNPVKDSFIEPSHTGISYSFTADGFYEEAYYRAIANPTNPSCPQAIMQFQHGTMVMNDDNSLVLTPFSVDGRQLQSNPCSPAKKSTYTRYNQTETFKEWAVYKDGYTKLKRLDLFGFDGTPMNPMFQVYKPPQMLPTSTLNPTATAATSSPSAKAKRWFGMDSQQDHVEEQLNKDARHIKRDTSVPFYLRLQVSHLFWTAIGMMLLGMALTRISKF